MKKFYWDKMDEENQKQKEQDSMPALNSDHICEPVWISDRATDLHTGECWTSQESRLHSASLYTPV